MAPEPLLLPEGSPPGRAQQRMIAAAAAAGPQEGRQLQLGAGLGNGRPLRGNNLCFGIVQGLPSAHGGASSTSRRHGGGRCCAELQSPLKEVGKVDDLPQVPRSPLA